MEQERFELVRVTRENLDREHICCAISNERDVQVRSKKDWLRARFDEGLVFLKGNVRGKCFIEYLPAENAWAPVEADGWMYVNCLWVSGRFKGNGYSNLLLDACIADSREKGRKGLVMLSSKKKAGFLADPKYLRHKGFVPADAAAPYFELMCLPFEQEAEKPRFRACVKNPPPVAEGFALYYTNQCPFTAKYVPLLQAVAAERNVPLEVVRIDSGEKARSAPCPFTAFSLFYNGALVTHEILSEQKFAAILDDKGLESAKATGG